MASISIVSALFPTKFHRTRPRPPTTPPLFFSSAHHLLSCFRSLSSIKPHQTSNPLKLFVTTKTQNGAFNIDLNDDETNAIHHLFDEKPQRTVKFVLLVFVWASVSLALSAFVGDNNAHAQAVVGAVTVSSDSIRASNLGLKFANALRGFGWPDQAVVFALATLPVVELRGAIPVGYWLQLKPFVLTLLAVLGNMVPVPFIILYLKRFASFLARNSPSASHFLELLFERAREKAGPIEEFQWLGLMLFVAVPFPGTGAWTGAIIASILDMPFWSAVSANFFGVVLAGLLVNLLVNLGLKYAIMTGVILFLISTFMWSVLRSLKRSMGTTK